ncbi:MAG TPA: MoaD/ThiS family protein [Anaerolineae bacterium]|nr:MoaD/ThiS family protein [Anaerolineae bacterium]
MKVTVHLHTILQRQTPEGLQRQLEVMLLSGSTLADLIEDLGIEMPLEGMLLVVNGRTAPSSHILNESDQVHLMPAISGG